MTEQAVRSDYGKLLKHPLWQRKRLEVLQRENFKCEWCGATEETLHVHHLFYISGRKPWEYPEFVLIVLCEHCHTVCHNLPGGGLGFHLWDKEFLTRSKPIWEAFQTLNSELSFAFTCSDPGSVLSSMANHVRCAFNPDCNYFQDGAGI